MRGLARKLRAVAAALALALGGTAVAAVAVAPAAQASTYTNCYVAMDGKYYCYRYCTFYEYANWGCRNGWVYWNTWYA